MGKIIYKIVSQEVFSASDGQGHIQPMPIDESDGYIHMSTREQLEETLKLHFAGKGPQVLLAVDESQIKDELRYEPSRGGQLFPHIYGNLQRAAIVWSAPVEAHADRSLELPEQLQ